MEFFIWNEDLGKERERRHCAFLDSNGQIFRDVLQIIKLWKYSGTPEWIDTLASQRFIEIMFALSIDNIFSLKTTV